MISDRLTPPGVSVKRQISYFALAAGLFLFVWSLGFFFSYADQADKLYYLDWYRVRHVKEGAVIKPFLFFIQGRMVGFRAYVLFCAGTAAANFRSFYAETKSIYVMKRLPRAWEHPVRCLAVPLLAVLAGFLFAVLLTALYWLFYRYATPEVCLPAGTHFVLWEAF